MEKLKFLKENFTDKICNSKYELYDHIFQTYGIDGDMFEFGVYEGTTINYISSLYKDKIIYGFDSFEGLPEKWRNGFEKGAFNLNGNFPNVNNNVKLFKGWFNESLPIFLKENDIKKIGFIHIDCDIYSSTKDIFTILDKFITKNTVIVFDEYYNYPGWEDHEYKAFQEYIIASGKKYKYICYNASHEQVAVIIL